MNQNMQIDSEYLMNYYRNYYSAYSSLVIKGDVYYDLFYQNQVDTNVHKKGGGSI